MSAMTDLMTVLGDFGDKNIKNLANAAQNLGTDPTEKQKADLKAKGTALETTMATIANVGNNVSAASKALANMR